MGKGHHGMGSPRELERGLAFHGIWEIAVAERRADRAAHSEPAEPQWQRERGFSILGDGEVVFVGDVPQVRSFDIDAHLKFVGLQCEVVRVLNFHHQIQIAAGETHSPNHGVIEPDIRLSEVVAQTGTAEPGQETQPHYANIDLLAAKAAPLQR
jgi:hypothetical protein